MATSLFDKLGGKPTLQRVHRIFYDRIFSHPWLGPFFAGIKRSHLEDQQTDFMAQAFGGPKLYMGKSPIHGHKHIMITDEIFTLRSKILAESIRQSGVPEELLEQWIRIDGSFRPALVKRSPAECTARWGEDHILDIPKPVNTWD